MKITDCVIRTRTIVAGVIFCILFAVLWSYLSRPIQASAADNRTVILEAGTNRADDSMSGMALQVPEGDVTLDLNGKDLSVLSVSGRNTTFTVTGKGSLTVTDFIRISEGNVLIAPGPAASVTVDGGVYCRNSELIFQSGSFSCNGKYVQADTIRIEGGSIFIDAERDAIRTDRAFYMTGGTADIHGNTHGLHLEGTAEITGGTLTMKGGDSAYYAARPDLVPEDVLDKIAAGRSDVTVPQPAAAQTAQAETDNAASAAAQTTQADTGKAASAAGTQQALAQTTTTASAAGAASSITAPAATAADSASSVTSAADAVLASSADAVSASSAEAASSSSGAASSAETALSAASASSAETAASGAPEAVSSPEAASSSSGAASSASSASASDREDTVIPVSKSGGDSSSTSSPSAGNVKSVQVPAMGDSGMLFYGFAMLVLAISGFAYLAGKGYFHETDTKRRP